MRFELKKRKDKWRVVLVGANNEKIAWTESYNSKQSALEAIDLIKSSDSAPVVIKGEK